MGDIVIAECPCGFASGELCAGGGMLDGDHYWNLAGCDHCRTVVSVRVSSVTPPHNRVRLRCPTCRRTVRLLEEGTEDDEEGTEDDTDVGLDTRPPRPGLRCPHCQQLTLVLEGIGEWD